MAARTSENVRVSPNAEGLSERGRVLVPIFVEVDDSSREQEQQPSQDGEVENGRPPQMAATTTGTALVGYGVVANEPPTMAQLNTCLLDICARLEFENRQQPWNESTAVLCRIGHMVTDIQEGIMELQDRLGDLTRKMSARAEELLQGRVEDIQ